MSGTTLIVDRYSYSGVAFSTAKGLDIQWCKVKHPRIDWILTLNSVAKCYISHAGTRDWVVGPRFGGLPGHITRGNPYFFFFYLS